MLAAIELVFQAGLNVGHVGGVEVSGNFITSIREEFFFEVRLSGAVCDGRVDRSRKITLGGDCFRGVKVGVLDGIKGRPNLLAHNRKVHPGRNPIGEPVLKRKAHDVVVDLSLGLKIHLVDHIAKALEAGLF